MTKSLQSSLYSRDLMDRACGVLVERQGLSHEAALHWLITQSRDGNTALQDISPSVLAGTPAPGR
jgi:AmiR/NasT family two-component response regulator